MKKGDDMLLLDGRHSAFPPQHRLVTVKRVSRDGVIDVVTEKGDALSVNDTQLVDRPIKVKHRASAGSGS